MSRGVQTYIKSKMCNSSDTWCAERENWSCSITLSKDWSALQPGPRMYSRVEQSIRLCRETWAPSCSLRHLSSSPGVSWYLRGMLWGVCMCHALYLPTEPPCLYNTLPGWMRGRGGVLRDTLRGLVKGQQPLNPSLGGWRRKEGGRVLGKRRSPPLVEAC